MKKYSVLEKSIIAKTTVNQVIAMRAIQRRLSTEIRRQLPVRQTVASVGAVSYTHLTLPTIYSV